MSSAVSVPASLPEAVVSLNDGIRIPLIGLGVYQSAPGTETYDAVRSALKLGYRHIDTASLYGNERDVGRAVRDSGIPRSEIFITTKLWVKGLKVWEEDLPPSTATAAATSTSTTTATTTTATSLPADGKAQEDNCEDVKTNPGYEYVMAQAKNSLANLGTFIDLYLMHSPHHPTYRLHMWRAMEDLKSSGKVRSIGVSNFGIAHMQELFKSCRVRPSVNQLEVHPFLQRTELAAFCIRNGVVVEAYSPLAKAKKMQHATLMRVAGRRNKTTAQVMLRWSLQKGYIILPKSTREARIQENAKIFDFTLTPEDMSEIDQLEEHLVTGWDPTTLE